MNNFDEVGLVITMPRKGVYDVQLMTKKGKVVEYLPLVVGRQLGAVSRHAEVELRNLIADLVKGRKSFVERIVERRLVESEK